MDVEKPQRQPKARETQRDDKGRAMENGKSIGTERTILDALYASRRELDAEIAEESARIRDLEARRFDMSEQIARIDGDTISADYYRAEAAYRREDTPETRQAVHVAFVRMMAHVHLKNGTVPLAGGTYAQAIEEEMERQRAGEIQ